MALWLQKWGRPRSAWPPSALCESKKPQRGARSHPSFPSEVGSTGVLGELGCLPLGFWWGVRVYLRRTSQALHAPGDPSPRLCGSTSPPSRGARSLECLYPCSRISLGVFWGPSPALTGHRLIHMWRWHVARGAGLAGPLLLRASLPLFCSGAAAASSGWTSRPQEGRGHFGGRRGGERARSGEKPGWQTAPAHPGLGPGAGRGGVYAVGRSRAIPCAPPTQSAPEWLWAVGGHGVHDGTGGDSRVSIDPGRRPR